jgi:elongation factor 2
MLPAVRDGIRSSMADARPSLLEPLQEMQIEGPGDSLGDISRLIQNKRGQLLNMDQEGDSLTVKAMLPVAEIFGWSSDLRSATRGRGSSFIIDQKFEKLPESLSSDVVKKIRQRKGLGVNE